MKQTFFRKAAEQAKKSDYVGPNSSPAVGCVISYKGTILALGHNSNKTSPIQKKYNRKRFADVGTPDKLHAECSALTKIKFLDIDFSKVQLYTYRELKSGKIANSRPCPSCMAMIKDMGIKHIYYTTNEGYCEERLV